MSEDEDAFTGCLPADEALARVPGLDKAVNILGNALNKCRKEGLNPSAVMSAMGEVYLQLAENLELEPEFMGNVFKGLTALAYDRLGDKDKRNLQ